MSIILPNGLTPAEIRILQEFRRLNTDNLSLETLKAIKHPGGALGESEAASLVGKGLLTSAGDAFTLTGKGTEFLAIEAKPAIEETSAAASATAASPQAGAV